jgi:transketolase
MTMLTERELEEKSIRYRRTIIEIKACGAGHNAGDLSRVDILNVPYNRILRVNPATFEDTNRDYYIQSKGALRRGAFHRACGLRVFSKGELKTLNKYGSHFIGHPTRKVNGVEQNTASPWRASRIAGIIECLPSLAMASWRRDRTGRPR